MKNAGQRGSDESDNNTSASTPTAGGDGVAGVRTTGRVKKPKAVFDPSDNYLPRAARMSIDVKKPSAIHKVVPLTAKAAAESTKHLNPLKKVVVKKEPVATPEEEEEDAEDVPPGELCYLCKKPEPKRGSNNIFVSCSVCERKCHRACVTHNYKDFKVLREKFKCDYCRDCSECKEVPGVQLAKLKLITCTICGAYFHRTCHTPHVRHNNLAKWKCASCNTTLDTSDSSSVGMQANEIREIIGEVERKQPSSAPSTSTAAPAAAPKRQLTNGEAGATETSGSKKPRLDGENKSEKTTPAKHRIYDFKVEVPNVKGWSVEQVYGLVEQFFPDEAKAFREHDIDGDAILVLKRSDILTHMPFKLGPALRIYNLILKLQTRINDSTLAWDL